MPSRRHLVVIIAVVFATAACAAVRPSPLSNERISGVLPSDQHTARALPSDPRQAAILKAVNEGAHYAGTVLLDENGKARSDYHLLDGEWYEYEPAWHTGQLVNALVQAYRVTGEEDFLRAARRGGDWWVGLQITDHPRLRGMIRALHGDYIGDYIVFATVSDGTPGLFELYHATGEERYARVPTEAGAWMLEHMYVPEEAIFYDTVDLRSGEVNRDRSPFWPDVEEQTLNHVARPNNEGSLFKDMFEFTGEERYRETFLAVSDGLVMRQGPEGLWMEFMPNFQGSGTFHPRFNLWYAESLVEAFELTGDEKYLRAAVNTARRYAETQRPDGTIYYVNYLDGSYNENSISGSTTAFAGILWLRLLQHGVGEEFTDNIERSVEWVLRNRYSIDHPDPNLAGAFLETRTRRRQGRIWLVNRDVATSFGLRFLADYYRFTYTQ